MQDCTLAIERTGDLTPDRFYDGYVRMGLPVVIQGALDRWPALRRWTPEYFTERFGDHPVVVEVQGARDPHKFFPETKNITLPLREFIARLPIESPKHYLQKSDLLAELPALHEDALLGDIAAYQLTGPIYRKVLAQKLSYPPIFWFGPGGSFSTLHYDQPNNLFAQVMGRKLFYLWAPESEQYFYSGNHELCARTGVCLGCFSPVEVEQPDLGRYPDFVKARRFQVTLEAGDLLFIPSGWWHYVKGLETGISISNWWKDRPVRMRTLADHLGGAVCRIRQKVEGMWSSTTPPLSSPGA